MSDVQLADVLGLSPAQFARLPLFLRVFCREFLAAGAVTR